MINRFFNPPKKQSFFLFGPRQTGKTFLLKNLYDAETSYYIDLLKSEEYLRYMAHPELLRDMAISRPNKITHIIIDEVQRVPALLNEVHSILESNSPPIFVLTGSSARKLKRSHANLLAGRALTYKLYPLSKPEIGDSFSLQRALCFGTLPKIYLEESADITKDLLRSYVTTYLKEEIEQEAQIRKLDSFVRFLNIAADSNGNLINYSNISRDVGVSYQTVKTYYQILTDTLLGFLLYPYLKSKRKRLAQQPKFYFFDTGVTRALNSKLTQELIPKTIDFGDAFEHFVILEIIRNSDYHKKDYEFYFYRTEAKVEVDLIIEKPNGEVCAVEIKSTDQIHSTHLRGLKSFSDIHPGAILYCVSMEPYQRQIDNITILPWSSIYDL